jgi:hypothetical protein
LGARRFWLGVVGAVLAGGLSVRAEPDPSLEHRVKAAFLYNFAKFVDWPTNAFTSADAPFAIAVFGDESLAQVLEQTVKGKSIGNRTIQTRRITDTTRIRPCQILFVARSKAQQSAQVLAALGSANVLLVGESPGFLTAGGAISFTNHEGQVRFEVDTAASERAGLKISSKLLRLATSVTSTTRRTSQ